MTMCKKDDKTSHQGLSLDIWRSRKDLGLLQNIYVLEPLHYKRNPFITTVVDESTFLKIFTKTVEDIFAQVLR